VTEGGPVETEEDPLDPTPWHRRCARPTPRPPHLEEVVTGAVELDLDAVAPVAGVVLHGGWDELAGDEVRHPLLQSERRDLDDDAPCRAAEGFVGAPRPISPSGPGAVAKQDHAAPETPFVHQLEFQADILR
jgi:hypothetical protein